MLVQYDYIIYQNKRFTAKKYKGEKK